MTTMTKQQIKSFTEVVKPVIQWLNENVHQHHTVIVTPTNAEILERSLSTGEVLEFLK